jgi:hypothetical protein
MSNHGIKAGDRFHDAYDARDPWTVVAIRRDESYVKLERGREVYLASVEELTNAARWRRMLGETGKLDALREMDANGIVCDKEGAKRVLGLPDLEQPRSMREVTMPSRRGGKTKFAAQVAAMNEALGKKTMVVSRKSGYKAWKAILNGGADLRFGPIVPAAGVAAITFDFKVAKQAIDEAMKAEWKKVDEMLGKQSGQFVMNGPVRTMQYRDLEKSRQLPDPVAEDRRIAALMEQRNAEFHDRHKAAIQAAWRASAETCTPPDTGACRWQRRR